MNTLVPERLNGVARLAGHDLAVLIITAPIPDGLWDVDHPDRVAAAAYDIGSQVNAILRNHGPASSCLTGIAIEVWRSGRDMVHRLRQEPASAGRLDLVTAWRDHLTKIALALDQATIHLADQRLWSGRAE